VSVRDLATKLQFRNGASAPNRVVLAALTNGQSHDDGTLSDAELHWLSTRAAGGFGVVTSCASHVAQDGQGWRGELGCFDDAHVPGLRRLAAMLRERGALSLLQIFHGGARADAALSGTRAWSSSASDDGAVREANQADLERVVEQFAAAAARAHVAGLNGVEIHGAHGYLLTQFLSSVMNRRSDAWGGSLQGRARLLREVVRAVRMRTPASFLVGVRLSPEDFGHVKGLDLDESLQLARWLVDDGVDFIHLSLWRALRNSTKYPDLHPVTLFRAALPRDIAIFAAGGVWTHEQASQVLELGADAVALGRSAIANPDWPRQLAQPDWEPRRPPLTAAELGERGLSAPFVEYMRQWQGFVAG
jgi:2,4-dienoyl-CoA reductase-like NADH-dependent reductase (Old Yellow Enzyme family)